MSVTREILNKTMDRDDLLRRDARPLVAELNCLVRSLQESKLAISSWYGMFDLKGPARRFEKLNRGFDYRALPEAADDEKFPWFLYWQICWVVLNNDFRPGQHVLDLGGGSSLFSFYLASRGCRVTSVDKQKALIDNADRVASHMGWNLVNLHADMSELEARERFDHITSICVLEHLRPRRRRRACAAAGRLLERGGCFSLTFDFQNPCRSLHIGSMQELQSQLIEPSGLSLRGNRRFFDNRKRYLLQPFYSKQIGWKRRIKAVLAGDFALTELMQTKTRNDYTFGALFLQKG